MSTGHILGFPRIGPGRELKWALESYWRGEGGIEDLLAVGRNLRRLSWQWQREAGLDFVCVGDFSYYDHVLDMSALLGVVPERFGRETGEIGLDTVFHMARGRAQGRPDVAACEMTKWFDTNYHYIVPEFRADRTFHIGNTRLFDEVREACELGHRPKPVLVGPLTYLWLGKLATGGDRLPLLENLLPAYREILQRLAAAGAEWVQLDEPILALDLPPAWLNAFERGYHVLRSTPVKILLATYFGALDDNTSVATALPVAGLHIDLVRAPLQLIPILDRIGDYKILSLGLIDGRNVWRADLNAALDLARQAQERLGERLWLASSCSLLHVPLDVNPESGLDPEIRSWIAFARQKLKEVTAIKRAIDEDRQTVSAEFDAAADAIKSRRDSIKTRNPEVRAKMARMDAGWGQRHGTYATRRRRQQARLRLPLFPTTTIGSFPQTAEIRGWRKRHREGLLSENDYRQRLREEIRKVVAAQERYGLDVLVHGEPERGDMVEYFGGQFDGIAVTAQGWVQSYGSRCVKPPIIHGDISRPRPMTVAWSAYAQSLTSKPMKGMLTGPVTLLQWSFVRDDQPRAETVLQLALTLRDEVHDLEQAGLPIIQIDEPAFREGLPLRHREQKAYLSWAVFAFRVASGGASDDTQIHTHMCYSEFNDILHAIVDLDADVITIETARSRMELLNAFADRRYARGIGPGVYDIHSPRAVPSGEMQELAGRALAHIAAEDLWINPDCGLKTRTWEEVEAALTNMVECARTLRQTLATKKQAARAAG
ncbi:MAG TPA: 5-methyltetrahydropteroyltriglutamate--homocysteine S-methyltransferase [Gammaproteobacteria bacterium]|nr:5-methyltetrahydropteroyltriglutamate--homocysteine S-methyltransferase [Gammaproteobacteria bacterium]